MLIDRKTAEQIACTKEGDEYAGWTVVSRKQIWQRSTEYTAVFQVVIRQDDKTGPRWFEGIATIVPRIVNDDPVEFQEVVPRKYTGIYYDPV